MEFRNLTPFPAMAFDALDQHDRRFHAVVMRLSFEMQDDGALAFAPVQTPLATLPLRYEYAYGGENKVLVGDPAARRVPQRDRLPGRQPLPGSTGSPQAIAHGVCAHNPVGRGHAERWYLRAARPARIPAPQIEAPDSAAARLGRPAPAAGFGVVGRAWTPRLALAGTYDQRWLEDRHPRLPADFDFAYWNGAPADQQVSPHLGGDERISLFNLCREQQGTGHDADGNTVLSFDLPGHLPFVMVRFDDGRLGELAARLDTLIVDAAPDAGNPGKKVSVVCVWRATVATEPAVRVLEARMLARTDVIALGRQEHDDQAKGEGTMRSFAARQRKRTLPRWGARQDQQAKERPERFASYAGRRCQSATCKRWTRDPDGTVRSRSNDQQWK